MTVYKCVFENKLRIVQAQSENEASSVCEDVYGFVPEKISVMERNPDDK